MPSGPATPEALSEVVRRLRPALLQIERTFDRRRKARGLTGAAWATLEALADGGPQTVPQIARRWTLQRQNVQRTVDLLLERGFGERVENPEHRRSPLIGLTPTGADLVRDLRRDDQNLMSRIAPGLGAAEVDACRRVLLHLEAGFRYPGDRVGAGASPSAPSPSPAVPVAAIDEDRHIP